ncbi:MAG TPA: type II toxin-antitoxin system VapC family toxin [Roseiarcus sp.]|nr:type II toxin-antitoxin system VapC family toxin [Roseiarcus sp.]
MSENYVLDASALLCLLQDEKGADRVAQALPRARIGAVNFSEAFGKLVEAGLDDETVDSLIDSLQLEVIPFDHTQARLAGSLRRATRELGLSLGDRACLALARTRGAIALTCERSWTRLEPSWSVELVR